jgi:hypothetical protein
MSNHYHLCIETPDANLVDGMKWLQSTFANRFNRFRKEHGHVFQGRYNAILLDGAAVGPVCHYIHLNPVRAGIIDCGKLQDYTFSSFHRLWHPGKRRAFESLESSLESAGGLKDTAAGRRLYRDYLSWLSADDPAQKALGFESMCSGWAKGADDFRKSVLEDVKDRVASRVSESEASEMRESRWERATAELLRLLGRSDAEIKQSAKGAVWKVAIARMLRERYLVPNAWIAQRLQMGQTSTVQSAVSRHRTAIKQNEENWRLLQKHETLG